MAHLNMRYPGARFFYYAHSDHVTNLKAVVDNGLVTKGALEGTLHGVVIASDIGELVERCAYIFVTVL
jgi:hypothetical protein